MIQCLGSAVAVAAPGVPSWNAAYEEDNVGGLVAAMLAPVGGFGKFLLVLLSLGVTGNLAPTLYSLWSWFVNFLTADFQPRASFIAGLALGIRIG